MTNDSLKSIKVEKNLQAKNNIIFSEFIFRIQSPPPISKMDCEWN